MCESRMKRKIFKYLVFLSLMFCPILEGQQYPIYSQYWTSKFLINPAVAGHEGYTSINLTARKQWANLKGAPGTVALSGQTRLLRQSHVSRRKSIRRRRGGGKSRSGKVGIGGYVFSDDFGAQNKIGFQGTYAYHISLRNSQVSMALSLRGLQYRINKDEIVVENEFDQLLLNTADRGYVIDGGFGAYYSDKELYAGISIDNLAESFFNLNSREGTQYRLERQYNLMAGYRADLIDFIYIEPSVNMKLSEAAVAQMDLNLTAYLKEEYWGGLAYRTGSTSKIATETLGGKGSSLIIYAGARIDKVFVGYSFDYTLSSIQKFTYGSHEVMLAVRFGDNARRYRWLNRY